jgi:MtN3 and saliva related transmembrane protein
MEFFKIITGVIGVLMSLGYYPQAYKIWKLKSARELSLINYAILSIGTTLWLVYGILMNDSTIIVGFVFGVIGSWLVLALILKYRKADKAVFSAPQ